MKTLDDKFTALINKQFQGLSSVLSELGSAFTVFSDDGDVIVHENCPFVSDDTVKLYRNIRQAGSENIIKGEDFCAIRFCALDETNLIAAVQTGSQSQCSLSAVAKMLEISVSAFKNNVKFEQQIEMVSSELAETYEELVLLYKMSSNMKVTQADSNYLQLACDSLTDLVNVEGIAILIQKKVDNTNRLVLTAGAGLIDVNPYFVEQLHSRLIDEINRGREALLDSEIDAPFRYKWPERIRNIIAVPLQVNDKIIGLLVAINRIDKPDFDSTDVKLFNSVAHQCAIFIENGRLFYDLKELFIGTLKALTTSIDAKDQYTRGHSERVAFIAKWIAEKLAETEDIDAEQIHRIYLAGLLHDIGKIGINEAVLCKKGKLSTEEMDQIRQHPAIGASILSEIKQMTDVIPGVLTHHERIDGKGYPNGLHGAQINLIGKIISIADAFDAMTSKRTYRDAMTLEQAVEEIKKGTGGQFDEKVAAALLESDVYALWQIMQNGTSGVWAQSDLAEYSTTAVGVLLK